jgi:threonine dehydrogenase-like Zn-dependent dehydrogenase
MRLSGIAAVFAAALSVCACATPYGASDISASQIDPQTLQITGRGDARAASETIQHYVLVRAAEETSKRGFDLFLMLPSPGADVAINAAALSSSGAISSGKGGESVLVMMFRGERPSNAPANLYRVNEVLASASPHADR